MRLAFSLQPFTFYHKLLKSVDIALGMLYASRSINMANINSVDCEGQCHKLLKIADDRM